MTLNITKTRLSADGPSANCEQDSGMTSVLNVSKDRTVRKRMTANEMHELIFCTKLTFTLFPKEALTATYLPMPLSSGKRSPK